MIIKNRWRSTKMVIRKIKLIMLTLISGNFLYCNIYADMPQTKENVQISAGEFEHKQPKDKAKLLNTDVLQNILSYLQRKSEEEKNEINNIDGLTANICQNEIDYRTKNGMENRKNIIENPQQLSTNLLQFMARSGNSMGNITSQAALNEIISRLRMLSDNDDINEYANSLGLQELFNLVSQRDIKEWDKNEVLESVEKFVDNLKQADDNRAQLVLEKLNPHNSNSVDDKLEQMRNGETDKPLYLNNENDLNPTAEEIEKSKERYPVPQSAPKEKKGWLSSLFS